MKSRNYGIDLLKMLGMIMVICHHILSEGGVEDGLALTGLSVFDQLFHCFCYCAVDCFVMATGFIMCRHQFKYVRIFKLWRLVVGYSLVLVAVGWMVLPAGTVGWRDWAGAAMPVVFNRYWFFTEYVALFFSIPFLNKLLGALTGRERGILVLTGFGLLSVMPFVAGIDLFVIKWGYSFIWFLYLYLLGACLALGEFKSRIGTGWLWLALALGVLGSAGGVVVAPILTSHFGGGARLGELAYSYASPTLLFEAVSLLLLFAKVDVQSVRFRRVIEVAAPSTFIVYVVHSNDVFRQLVGWENLFLGFVEGGEWSVIQGTIVSAVVIFGVIILADLSRKSVLKLILNGMRHGND